MLMAKDPHKRPDSVRVVVTEMEAAQRAEEVMNAKLAGHPSAAGAAEVNRQREVDQDEEKGWKKGDRGEVEGQIRREAEAERARQRNADRRADVSAPAKPRWPV